MLINRVHSFFGYFIPVIVKIGVVEDPEIKITKIAGRTNFKISTGAGQATVTMTALCIDDANSTAEDKINNILEFIRRHDKMSDNDIYLVISRLVNGTRYYVEFEATGDTYGRNYLQCTLNSGKPKWKSYGVWEVNIQCEEVNT